VVSLFIIFVPSVSVGTGGYELNKVILKDLHDTGLPMAAKIGLVFICIFGGLLIFKIFNAAQNIFHRWSLAEIFIDENVETIFKLVKLYAYLIVLFVVGPSLINIAVGFPVLSVLISALVKLPWTHLAIGACIYLVGLMLKLANENKKDLEGTY